MTATAETRGDRGTADGSTVDTIDSTGTPAIGASASTASGAIPAAVVDRYTGRDHRGSRTETIGRSTTLSRAQVQRPCRIAADARRNTAACAAVASSSSAETLMISQSATATAESANNVFIAHLPVRGRASA